MGGVAATLVSCGGPDLQLPKPRREAVEADGTLPGDAGQEAAEAPDAEVAPTDAAADAGRVETALSAVPYVVVENGYGPVEKDTSNGEMAAGDGNPITLGGVVYPTGLGVHAASRIEVDLAGRYAAFESDVGVDDEVAERGSVVFRVLADGELLFDSGTMTGLSPTQSVRVAVTGRQKLELVVTDAGDGIGSDHADWAGAKLVR